MVISLILNRDKKKPTVGTLVCLMYKKQNKVVNHGKLTPNKSYIHREISRFNRHGDKIKGGKVKWQGKQ